MWIVDRPSWRCVPYFGQPQSKQGDDGAQAARGEHVPALRLLKLTRVVPRTVEHPCDGDAVFGGHVEDQVISDGIETQAAREVFAARTGLWIIREHSAGCIDPVEQAICCKRIVLRDVTQISMRSISAREQRWAAAISPGAQLQNERGLCA